LPQILPHLTKRAGGDFFIFVSLQIYIMSFSLFFFYFKPDLFCFNMTN